jgi:membrane-bound lytic murein transglycosylase A
MRLFGPLLILLALAGCVPPPPPPPGAAPAAAPSLTPVGFDALPGWRADRAAEAMPALLRGCARFATLPPNQALGGEGDAARLAGTAGQWLGLCAAAREVPHGDDQAARAFLEANFQPYAIGTASGADGLFTGYYEPEVQGARRRGGSYQTPILSRPGDLVQADLGAFADDLKGRSISGRLNEGRLVPYYNRAEIEGGALSPRRLELLWLADPTDAFFLQIQGAGRVRLADNRIVRVSFAGQNGRPYVPIGRILVERGEIARDQVSMQSIRAWLVGHPAQAAALMNENPSYVFFRELSGMPTEEGPPGALGVALTPGRSLAVDRRFIPLGAPVFVDTVDPVAATPWRRLLLAQDIGGAIKGPLRGDVFFGWGPAAEDSAGHMREPGRAWLLLPRALPAM